MAYEKFNQYSQRSNISGIPFGEIEDDYNGSAPPPPPPPGTPPVALYQRFRAKICNPLPIAAVIDPNDPITWGEPTTSHFQIPLNSGADIIFETFNPFTQHTPQVGDFFDSHRVFLNHFHPISNYNNTGYYSYSGTGTHVLNQVQRDNVDLQGGKFTMWEVTSLMGAPTSVAGGSRRKWPTCTQGVEYQCHPATSTAIAYCSTHAPGTNPLATHQSYGACMNSPQCAGILPVTCTTCVPGTTQVGLNVTDCVTGAASVWPDVLLNGQQMPTSIVGQYIQPKLTQPCATIWTQAKYLVVGISPVPPVWNTCIDMEITTCPQPQSYNCDGGVGGSWNCVPAPTGTTGTYTGFNALADCQDLCEESYNCSGSSGVGHPQGTPWDCYIPNSWATGIGTLGFYQNPGASINCQNACQPVYDTYNCDGPPPGGTWTCSIAPGQTGTFVGPNAQALCAALCEESYDCDGPPSWNCIQPNSWSTGIGGLGVYTGANAWTSCTSLCQESYDCDYTWQPSPLPGLYSCIQPNSWLTGIGTLGTYTNPGILGALSDCEADCQESYDCTGYPNYICNTTPVGTTGAYTGPSALQDCNDDCLPTYNCSGANPVSSLFGQFIPAWNCYDPWVGSGGGGMGGGFYTGNVSSGGNYNDCLAACNAPPDRYNCSGMVSDLDPNNPLLPSTPWTCYPVPAGSPLSPGTYATLPLCQAACIVPETWNCDLPWNQGYPTVGNCWDPGDGSGQYTSEQACLDVCKNLPVDDDETHPDRWDCESRWEIDSNGLSNLTHSCIPILWPNGDYATEQDCLDVCPPCELCCCEPLSIFPHTGGYICTPGTEVMLAASHDPCDCHHYSPIADFEPCVEDTGVEWGYDCPSTGPPCIGLIAGGTYTAANAGNSGYPNTLAGALAHCTDSCIATPLCQRIRSCPCGWTDQPGTIPGSIDCLSPQQVPNLPQTRMPAIEKCIQFNTAPFVPVIGDVWTYPSSWLGWTWTKVVVVDVSGTLATIITGQTRTIC